jgi:hypothetical protein
MGAGDNRKGSKKKRVEMKKMIFLSRMRGNDCPGVVLVAITPDNSVDGCTTNPDFCHESA